MSDYLRSKQQAGAENRGSGGNELGDEFAVELQYFEKGHKKKRELLVSSRHGQR